MATNKAYRRESNNDEVSYGQLQLCVIRPAANRVDRDDNRQQQAMENIVNIATGRRMLYAVIAVFALSLLLTVATLILTITRMSVKDRTEGASKVKGDEDGCLAAEIKQHLIDLKEEIRANKVNQTEGMEIFDVKQQLAELKEEIRTMKVKQTEERVFGGVYKDCGHAYQSGMKISGMYQIDPDGQGIFIAYCDQKTSGGGWTVFQKRHDGSVNFYKGWNAYKRGFGDPKGDYWLGLDNIHRLTKDDDKKIRVDLALHNETAFAEYSLFAVSNETGKYELILGGYSGTAGDSLTYHGYKPFTTKDRDNDALPNENCAVKDHGAWWYKDCYNSNLNAQYLNGQVNGQGMVWYSWKNDYISVTRSEMKIRPKAF